MGIHECHASGKKAAGDAQGRTQAEATALTSALKENATLQSLAEVDRGTPVQDPYSALPPCWVERSWWGSPRPPEKPEST